MILSVKLKRTLNLNIGIKQIADRVVIVELIDQESDIFTDINTDVIITLEKLGVLIDGIGGHDLGDQAALMRLIKCFHAVCEEAKSRSCKDTFCFALFQLTGNIKHAVAGCDHVIDDHDILAFDRGTKELMSDNGIASVYDTGIVSPLIKRYLKSRFRL